jgi:ribose/xylose/arabinose/galactoside ABC-type transport system permease subunit
MKMLMITWTDIFEGTGTFFEWIFKGMRVLGHIPNVIIWLLIIGILAYWTMRLGRYRKQAERNSTIE